MDPAARKPRVWGGTWIAVPYVKFPNPVDVLKRVLPLVLIAVATWPVLGGMLVALIFFVSVVAGISASSIESGWLLPFLAAGILPLGAGLYWFRCRLPGWYGGLEIAVGFLLAAHYLNEVLGNLGNADTRSLTALGALYIVVRGLDNIYKSLKKPTQILRWNRVFFGRESVSKL
ncbi:hypothetical protein [Reyranella soli]|uniref:Uncharacterized protein n=1 Tax=Reyranella soli TaxID=1230389 RepID=A0A512N8G5_9HYPH|nr:hypothetical protein [Reyranella soli]GEP55274.1 hypothetical protein RSO01_24400 [Reyranella soli]